MVACAGQCGTIALLAAALAVGSIARPVSAQIPCGYKVSAIIKGPYCAPFGYPTTIPGAIAEDGTVVGFYNVCTIGSSAPFRWTEQSGLMTLSVPFGYSSGSAWAIDDQTGWIAGAMTPTGLNNPTAVVWMGNTPIDLGTLPGGNYSQASGACGGRVVGEWGNDVTGNPGLQAFLWQDGVMRDLGPDLGTPRGEAHDVNRRGQVVGWMGQSFLIDSHAFIWQDGETVDLGVIPGGFTAYALAVNDQEPAQVVGTGQVPQDGFTFGVARPFLWDGTRLINLGILPGHDHCGASDIGAYNGIIQIVGAVSGGGNSAFVWQEGVMTDLNDLIPLEAGVHVDIAHGINNAGQIACEGTDANADVVGIVLDPIEPPLGDLTCDGEVDRSDLDLLLAAWGPCPQGVGCPGDFNGNGMVDVVDLLIQLANWG